MNSTAIVRALASKVKHSGTGTAITAPSYNVIRRLPSVSRTAAGWGEALGLA